MKLSERMKAAQAERGPEDDLLPASHAAPTRAPVDEQAVTTPADPFATLKRRAQDALFARLGSRLYDASFDEKQLDAFVVQELGKVIDAEQAPLTPVERARLVAEITNDVLGYGAIERHLADPTVTEVMVNAVDGIYVEREGQLELTESSYLSDEHVRRVIERIVSKVGRRIDESSPMVDARLPDGSRVNAIIPPLAVDGPGAHDPEVLAAGVRDGRSRSARLAVRRDGRAVVGVCAAAG